MDQRLSAEQPFRRGKIDLQRVFVEERPTVQGNSRQHTVVKRPLDDIRIDTALIQRLHPLGGGDAHGRGGVAEA